MSKALKELVGEAARETRGSLIGDMGATAVKLVTAGVVSAAFWVASHFQETQNNAPAPVDVPAAQFVDHSPTQIMPAMPRRLPPPPAEEAPRMAEHENAVRANGGTLIINNPHFYR